MKLSHAVATAIVLSIAVAGLSACEREGPAERAGERIDRAADKAADKIERAGDKVKDAAEDAKK
jgi:hypothetical protein